MNKPQPFTENKLKSLFRKAGDDFILLETAKPTAEEYHSYLFTNAQKRLIYHAGDDPLLFLQQCEHYTRQGYYLAGWFSYEFGYGLEKSIKELSPPQDQTILANLGIYPACQIFDHTTANPNHTRPEKHKEKTYKLNNITLSQSQQEYIEHIRKIKAYILAGDTYQVNYTLKLFFDFPGSKETLYLNLRRNQQVNFAAYIKQKDATIMSFSPELFFRKQDSTITVRPMKGTMSRGCTLTEDQQNSLFLQTDLKNRAENIMIVDLLRNDLGKIAKKGSVQPLSLFDVETYNSLLQMTSTIQAEVDQNTSLVQIFKALFPCGSVTGAPKIRTMEIINELETEIRGVYTGAIGFLDPDGSAIFNVPIRTLVLDGNKGQMGIGSGIVADSDPAHEWQECLLKGQFLTNAQKSFELIETLLWQPKQGYQFIIEHGQRLQNSAQYFNFIFSVAQYFAILEKKETELLETSRIRITLDREGNITIQATPCAKPAPFKPNPTKLSSNKKICFATQTVSSRNPYLYHKTTHRDLYNTTWETATKSGYIDTIFTNEKNEITEGCISNLFVFKDNILRTPPLTAGLLPGIFRQILLEKYPEQVREQTLYKEDLLDKKAIVCIGNSVRGLIPVRIST